MRLRLVEPGVSVVVQAYDREAVELGPELWVIAPEDEERQVQHLVVLLS